MIDNMMSQKGTCMCHQILATPGEVIIRSQGLFHTIGLYMGTTLYGCHPLLTFMPVLSQTSHMLTAFLETLGTQVMTKTNEEQRICRTDIIATLSFPGSNWNMNRFSNRH